MLAEYPVCQVSMRVLRLAAIPSQRLETILLERRIKLESLEEILELLSPGDLVTSPEDVLDHAFRPRSTHGIHDTPFPRSRFSDGTLGIYYSATEERTCKDEIAFHLNSSGPEGFPRYYSLIISRYEGETVDLRGADKDHPELVSKDDSGYSHCQNLAKSAVEQGHDGFLTPSARAKGGTCVPVFRRSSLSQPDISATYRATTSDSQVTFQETLRS